MATSNTSNSPAISISDSEVIDIDHLARWEVYRRLKELSISCECKLNEPLKVRVNDAATVLQLWCVIRAFTTSRQVQADYLERCWILESQA